MNGFGFILPGFLWLLPLAALPVVFHLFFRVRRKTIPFSTFMFFHRIDPRLSARRRLREWLLLALRILALLLIILFLAGPVSRGTGFGGSTDAVLVVDNSGSMGARAAGGDTKLDLALQGAEAVLGTLGGGDGAGLVLLVDDPAVACPAGLVPDREALRAALRSVQPTEASGRPAEALGRALERLAASRATRFEVHVFTDLQDAEWRRAASGFGTPRAGLSVQVHRITTPRRGEPNVGIAALEQPARRPIAGRRFPLTVRLENAGSRDAAVRLQSEDDQGRRATESVEVPAQGAKPVVLWQRPETPGLHWQRVWIEGDGFAADNRAVAAYDCVARESVLLAGEPAEFGLLQLALAPSGDGALSGLWPEFVAPAALPAALVARSPALVAVTWETLAGPAGGPLRGALEGYVGRGGRLLVLPALLEKAGAAGRVDWLQAGVAAEERAAEGRAVMLFQKEHPLFEELRDASGEVVFRGVRAMRYQEVLAPEGAARLLGLEDGRALLAEVRRGPGVVLLAGLAFHPDSGNLPLKGYFLPLAHSLALAGGRPGVGVRSVVAGDRVHPEQATNELVRLGSAPGTPALDWQGSAAAVPAIPRSGLYWLDTGSNRLHVAARAAPGEAQEAFIGGEHVPALEGLTHRAETWERTGQLLDQVRAARRGRDFTGALLLLGLLAVLAEGLLANVLPTAGSTRAAVARQAARVREAVQAVGGRL